MPSGGSLFRLIFRGFCSETRAEMCGENPQNRNLTIEKMIAMSVYFVEEKR
jgi:hypothetical protein